MWWPKRLRRPSDVWSRLPLPARLTRLALTLVVLLVPLTMVLRERLSSAGWRGADAVLFGVEGGMVLVAAAITTVGFWWAHRRGLTTVDSARFLFGATTASSGWNEAATARMLLPSGGRVRPPDEDDPVDMCRAIKELLASLVEESVEVRRAAEEVADSTLQAIHQVDEELASLERNANESEVGRLSARLAMLGGPAAGDTGEHLELRTLLQQQLEVIRRMRDSQHVVRGRRKLHIAVLQGLWSAVSAASNPVAVPARGELAGRIAGLAAELRDGALGYGRSA